MEGKRVLILGGYGNTGKAIARLLLQESNANLVIAGRSLERAEGFCRELQLAFEDERVSSARLDAADLPGMRQAFSEADFVIVASSTTKFAHLVVQAALEARIGYLDLQISPQKISFLKAIQSSIQQAGSCLITDGGFHPGLPAYLVRYAALYFDQLETARVGSVIKEDWKNLEISDSTAYELVEMMNDFEMSVYRDGHWKRANLLSISDYLRMDFGPQFGVQTCAPMMLEEMRVLPELYPSLAETGFYVGSFNWFTDWVIMPISMVAMRIAPRLALNPSARLMYWGLKTFSKPPYGTLLQVHATGQKDGKPKALTITISHPNGYMFTAIPVVACTLQYLDGTINRPGLWFQAHIVEMNRFMTDMQHMGIKVKITEVSS